MTVSDERTEAAAILPTLTQRTADMSIMPDSVHEFVASYESRDPDYTPTDAERALIEDAINTYQSDLLDHGAIEATASRRSIPSREAVAKPEYRVPKSQTWPHGGPAFNAWEGDVYAFVEEMRKLQNHPWWCQDMPLKYLSIWIDTRDGGFILKDRDGNRISPDRVTKAMAGWRKFAGDETGPSDTTLTQEPSL